MMLDADRKACPAVMRRRLGAAAVLGAALVILSPPPLEATAVEGTWTATEAATDRVHLTLHWNRSNWGQTFGREELRGVSVAAIGASGSTPVTFRIEREAGVILLEGTFREGRGSGTFRFEPDSQFASRLAALDVRDAAGISNADLLRFALADVRVATVREFVALGLSSLSRSQLLEMAIHGVTPEYVRSMRALGVADSEGPSAFVEMRIHGVTPEFVRKVSDSGLGILPRRDLVSMRIHGVTPEVIAAYHALGYTELSPRQLIEMRIHRVTPELVAGYRALGYTELLPRQLVEMRIHGVTPEYIRQMRSEGVRDDAPVEALVRMRIHRIGGPGPRRP